MAAVSPVLAIVVSVATSGTQATSAMPFQRFLADEYFGGADPWTVRGVRSVFGAGPSDAP